MGIGQTQPKAAQCGGQTAVHSRAVYGKGKRIISHAEYIHLKIVPRVL
jgi:hypothetical protein